jgi:hypothetical protein
MVVLSQVSMNSWLVWISFMSTPFTATVHFVVVPLISIVEFVIEMGSPMSFLSPRRTWLLPVPVTTEYSLQLKPAVNMHLSGMFDFGFNTPK